MKSTLSKVSNFFKNHFWGFSLWSIILSVIGSFVYEAIKQPHTIQAETQSNTIQTATKPDRVIPKPSESDAPIVRFADGKRATINFSVVTLVIPDDAPKVVSYAGSEEYARELLASPTLAAIYGIFEPLSFKEASMRRQDLQATLVNLLRPKYKEAGITLVSISLEAFTVIENPSVELSKSGAVRPKPGVQRD